MTFRIASTIASAITSATRTAVAPLAWNPAAHLMSRFAYGPRSTSAAWLATYGPDLWYSKQVGYGSTYRGYAGSTSVSRQGPLLSLSPFDVRTWLADHGDEYGWDAMDQLSRVTIGLQAFSVAQLYETLVDFFSNHLNVPNFNGDLWNTRHAYDRDVIRKYAMGLFTSMLLASSKHPAMLTYLNLAESNKIAVNENYGRELLELHTVGLQYTENDVKNAARLLTGRTLDEHQHYLFDDYIHPTGKVTVLGFTDSNAIAEDGERAGDNLLRYLAAHPYTATRLARKLCQRFVSDSPSATLVAAVAKAYTDNKTQILPMVSTILRSTEFWESRGRKVRRPTENLLATIRILGVPITNLSDALDTLSWMTDSLGHRPLDWPAPNGYPDTATSWRSAGTLLKLWQFHQGFVGGWWDGFGPVNVDTLYGAGPATSGEAISLLGRRLTGQSLSLTHRAALQRFVGESSTTPMADSRLSWLDETTAALILDGPHHALR